VGGLREDISEIHRQGKLRDISGVGPSIASKIAEFLDTGHSSYLEKMEGDIPPGVVELLTVPGLGPAKARQIYKTLGIRSLEDLAVAGREGHLSEVPGIGPTTAAKIVREVERIKRRTQRLLLSTALTTAELVVDLLSEHPTIARLEPAGSIRRRKETIGDIDLLAASDQPHEAMQAFIGLPIVKEVIATGPQKSSVLTYEDLQIDLLVVPTRQYGAALQHFTGSREHNIALRDLATRMGYKLNEYGLFTLRENKQVAFAEEEDIYAALGLACPAPELRENGGEIEAAASGTLPALLTLADLRGDLHVHSDWSDGKAPVEEMVRAAIARGYEYIAITDHSHSLGVARGLTPERVRQQRRLIDALNRKYAPFRIFAGIEVEIRGNGALDFPDEILAGFDIVTASQHSGGNQPRARLIGRIAGAMENPYVDILNHPTGRVIGRREPYDVDVPAIIAKAAERNVALEINSSPERLDLNDQWARMAKDKGVLLTISSDAHVPDSLDALRYGVSVARRAWLEPRNVLNTLPLGSLLERLRRSKIAA
jgi:DNA polymerase (family X)